jgi:hypothetical protein
MSDKPTSNDEWAFPLWVSACCGAGYSLCGHGTGSYHNECQECREACDVMHVNKRNGIKTKTVETLRKAIRDAISELNPGASDYDRAQRDAFEWILDVLEEITK